MTATCWRIRTDTTGYRQYTLYVKDLRTGQTLGEHIERVDSVTWANDNKTLFYTTEDAVSKRSDKFWRHTLGSDKSDLLFDEKDEIFDLGVGRSLDKKMIFLESESKTSHEYRFLPADNPSGQFKIIAPREPGHEYDVNHYEGQFYITTNKDAKNFRVVTAPVGDPSEKNWKPFINHNPKIKIDGLETFAGHLVISEREGGLEYLRVIDMKTGQSHRITTDESDYDISLGDNREFNTPAIRFNYQSMVTPLSIYDYDLDTRDRKLMKQQEVPGGFDAGRYEAKRIWAVARDGTKVPISIVYKKGVPLDGTAPMWLNGYGSYGLSYAPNFSSNRLALLDRGVIFAIAYIRGGGEMGEEWRDDGRMMSKMNTFYDFIDCAEYLVKNKYTSSDRLVIQGRSAGGMLMGAVTNLRPDLFKAVIAQVPFVDVINTMLDASLPLTTAEYIEWGNVVLVVELVLAGMSGFPAPWRAALIATFVVAALHAIIMPRWRFNVHRWEVTDEALYTRSGWFSVHWRIAPISRIQTIDSHRSVGERIFGLANVTATTASAAGPVRIHGLDRQHADRLLDQLAVATGQTPGDAT